MKTARTTIPPKLLDELNNDPEYKICSLYGYAGNDCEGRVTKEHAIIVAGSSYQARWAIIPLCAKHHDVDKYQDSHSMNKEMNQWVALCRATDKDILDVFHEGQISPLGKSKDLFQKKKYLIAKYGVWEQKHPIVKVDQSFLKDIVAINRIASSFNIEINAISTKRITQSVVLMGIECIKK